MIFVFVQCQAAGDFMGHSVGDTPFVNVKERVPPRFILHRTFGRVITSMFLGENEDLGARYRSCLFYQFWADDDFNIFIPITPLSKLPNSSISLSYLSCVCSWHSLQLSSSKNEKLALSNECCNDDDGWEMVETLGSYNWCWGWVVSMLLPPTQTGGLFD